jgi:hypothetical protein
MKVEGGPKKQEIYLKESIAMPHKAMLRKTVIAAFILAASWAAAQTCSNYTFLTVETPWDPTNNKGHLTGQHSFYTNSAASCTYSSSGQQFCSSACSAYGSASGVDTGSTGVIYDHTLGAIVNGGASSANGVQISCGATAAVTAVQCLLGTSCGAVIGFSGGAYGIGVNVSFPPSSIYTASQPYTQTCALLADPQYNPCDTDKNVPCGGDGGGGGCQGQCCNPPSPIIIDTIGEGFQLTSEPNGVFFDIRGNGMPVSVAWTARSSRNAFLALDRNGNGRIDSGKELFGNFTAQPESPDPNGYLALAVFDRLENGGNGDGVIDDRDEVYSKLLLWIDENHDGISQPEELHHLWELGVYSLSLKYSDSPYTDIFGNQFRYKGKVNPLGQPPTDHADRTSYDVFFVVGRSDFGSTGRRGGDPLSAANAPPPEGGCTQ